MLDAELLERPADLGRITPIDLRRQLSGVKIMRPAIGLEAHRQAALGEDLLQRPEGRGSALLVDQKRRIDRPGASSSVTMRSRGGWSSRKACRELSMQRHAWQRPPLALAPMRPLARRLGRQPRPMQMQLQPGVAPAKPWSLTRCSWKCLTVKP
jgi:hypothetical protein